MPTNTYTNYEGIKVQNHVLEVFRRNTTRPGDAHLSAQRRVESMLDTLYALPYGVKQAGLSEGASLAGWGYENCHHARRILYRWLKVFGTPPETRIDPT